MASSSKGGFVAPGRRLPASAILGPIGFVLLLGGLAPFVGIDQKTITEGLPRLATSARGLLTVPDWSALPSIAADLAETAEMALIGTVLAVPVSLFLACLMARNTSFHPFVAAIFRGVLSIVRAVPFFVWAMLLIALVGLGALPGILALILAGTTYGAKLFADSLEHVDQGPVDGVLAVGASAIAVRRHAIFPLALSDIGSQALFMLDTNVRMAISVGIVGAGGIGYAFSTALRLVQYGKTVLILLSIFAMVALVDALSRKLREKLA